MVSINVTNYSIQLGCILARDDFAQNYMGSRPEAKKCDFFIVCVRPKPLGGAPFWCNSFSWMDVVVFFVHYFFHTVEPIVLKLKTYRYFNKTKR